MTAQAIQKQIDAVYATQEHSEFSSRRDALMFFPGSYSVNVPVGFYTEGWGWARHPTQRELPASCTQMQS